MASERIEYIGVSELAASVGEALSQIAQVDKRMKSGATEIPSERTIRFYLEKGLLPRPSKRFGQTLVFGRVHLLHLLVIKKLQAEGVPLSAIPDILKKRGRTETELEELLEEDVKIFRSTRELDDFRKRIDYADDVTPITSIARSIRPPADAARETPPRHLSFDAPAASKKRGLPAHDREPPASGAKSYLKSLLSRRPPAPPSSPAAAQGAAGSGDVLFAQMAPAAPAKWTRHELERGLEINISEDYEPPTDVQGKTRLMEQLRKILGL